MLPARPLVVHYPCTTPNNLSRAVRYAAGFTVDRTVVVLCGDGPSTAYARCVLLLWRRVPTNTSVLILNVAEQEHYRGPAGAALVLVAAWGRGLTGRGLDLRDAPPIYAIGSLGRIFTRAQRQMIEVQDVDKRVHK
jgi:hypothetical protein